MKNMKQQSEKIKELKLKVQKVSLHRKKFWPIFIIALFLILSITLFAFYLLQFL